MEEVKRTLADKIRAFLAVDHGYGYGSGYGDGDGYGSNVRALNGDPVYLIDGVQTIIKSVHSNAAKGFVLQSDLTLKPCYIVKGSGQFAHGETLRDAMSALTDKLFEDMSEEDRIAAFIEAHPDPNQAYPNQDLYDWHHKLTGSCDMGRRAFLADRDLTLDGSTTVQEFIHLTKFAYGGTVIQNLALAYQKETT